MTTPQERESQPQDAMNYTVSILRRAQRELAGLPSREYERVLDAVRNLGPNPRPRGCLKLTGREEWRLRIGRYRVIYEIDDKEETVTVFHVGHRRDVYR